MSAGELPGVEQELIAAITSILARHGYEVIHFYASGGIAATGFTQVTAMCRSGERVHAELVAEHPGTERNTDGS